MKIPFYKNMTNAMKEIVDLTVDEQRLKEEFLFCHNMYVKARDAGYIHLPHTTETGEPVLQGARVQIYKIESYWESRRDAIREFLPREWVDEQNIFRHVER